MRNKSYAAFYVHPKVRSQLESLHLSHMIVDHVVTKAEIRLKGTRNLSTFRRLIQKTTEQKLRKNQFARNLFI